MSKFFKSEIVQKELEKMQELYLEINRMGLILSVDEKREQLLKMMELINVQQTMYTVSYTHLTLPTTPYV